MNFDMLIMNIIKGAAPCAVALDVGEKEIPPDFAEGFSDGAEGVRAYNRLIIDSVRDMVAAISINVSALLPYGLETVSDAVSYAKENGLFVIADAKCIGEPIAAQAEAELYFDTFGFDCVTVSAYYGAKGLAPFMEKCGRGDKSLFVLTHSDSGSPQDFQELTAGLRTVYRAVCEKVVLLGEKRTGSMGYSDIGIMIGGVPNVTLRELRRSCKKTFFFLTGYDGDKTTAHDINGAFDMKGLGGLVCVGRLITLPAGEGELGARIRAAAEEVSRDLRLCF